MTTGGITVREATPDDAPGIARVQVDAWRSTYRGIVPDAHLADLSYDERAQRWRTMRTDRATGHGVFVAEAPPAARSSVSRAAGRSARAMRYTRVSSTPFTSSPTTSAQASAAA